MECPKCGLEIDDKAMVCPNCKKVLKLACPVCKTINTGNTCKKCGYVIITKCHNCGKVNQTASKKCKKCGFDTEKSVILNEANGENYALMTVEFPDMDDIKRILGSAKLYNKFKINVEKIIFSYAKSIGLRCQAIDKKYVIRFLKDYTFKSSASSAIKAAIELINKITDLNCKLTKKRNSTIRCNVVLQKKSTEDDPYKVDSGFNISLVEQDIKSETEKVLSTFQVLADESVKDVLSSDYTITALNSMVVNNEMTMIYEVNIKDFVKVEFPEDEEDNDEIKIPNFVQNMLIEQDKLDEEALIKVNTKTIQNDSIYDINTIDFEEIKCDFIRTENIDAIFHIVNKFQEIPKGIVSIKTPEIYKPYTLKVLNAAAQTGKFNNIITLTCYDEMKYAPYSFFRELVSAIFEYTVSQKLFFQNDFSMFQSIDPNGLISDLITLRERNNDENIEDTRYIYYDIFLTLLTIIPKTLIYIEDFEKIDSSSYDVLKYIFQNFDQIDVSFLLNYDGTFSLHKDCHFLLMQPYYTEIALKPTSFEKMIEDNKDYYEHILHDFYFQRIAKYACGSSLFIDYAVQYLVESGIYEADEYSIRMVNPKTIIIPSSLDKLLMRRINLLQDDPDLVKFLSSLVLIGTRIDMATVECLGFKNNSELIEKLENLGYIYQYNNCIYFPNYNLLRKNLLSALSKQYLSEISDNLLANLFEESGQPTVTEANLRRYVGDKEQELNEWIKLASVDLSLGDFNAYVNCASKVLDKLQELSDLDMVDNINEKKLQIYSNIAKYLYDYKPEKTLRIANETLRNLEKSSDKESTILLCNKMINGALNVGNYDHALELTHKVLSLLPASSINPASENYNPYFFLMSLIHIQILFNVGAFIDCIDIGYRVLNVVNNDTIEILKPEHLSLEQFKEMIIDSTGYILFANVILLTGRTAEFLDIMKKEFSDIPKSFDLFVQLENLMTGKEVILNDVEDNEYDKFGKYIYYVIKAISERNDNYNQFAQTVYEAKIVSKHNGIYLLELFADVLIAYSYLQMNLYDKAEYILSKIINETNKKGMTLILYISWYVMSELYIKLNLYKIAFEILNNSLIQLERNENTSEYLLMLFKYNMYKVLKYMNINDKAEICIAQAKYLASKRNVAFNFDTDANHYQSADADEDTILNVDLSQINDTLPLNATQDNDIDKTANDNNIGKES